MGLLSPWFLAGLAALGLPLWLHLLRQFKRNPQPFSSLMFFEQQIQSSSKHRRLRYLRLLALRLALLALLVLLFANPFVNRASTSVLARKLTIIAIDRSFSMRFQNRMADAKAQAAAFVNGLTGSQTVEVLGLANRTAPVTQQDSDKGAIDSAIAEMEATDEASSYGEFSRALRLMEQTTNLRLDVHLFTDAQQTSMPNTFSDLQLGPNTSLTIHEIGSGETANWAVEGVNAPSRIYDAGTIRVVAGVAGWQTSEAVRKVSVLVDGHSVASKEIKIPSSGRTEVEFANLAIPYGLHRGEITLEPHDPLPEDDSLPFSIERSDPGKVLFLTRPGRSSESFFYKSALDASADSGLRVQVATINDSANVDLSSYGLVVLSDANDLEQHAAQHLTEYVSKGGSLLIVAGPATDQSGVVPIAGNRIVSTLAIQGSGAVSSDLFAKGVFDNVKFISTPQIALEIGDRVLARFADDSPLLIERAHGEGKLAIFASTLDNSNSDFPVHVSFVPFVTAFSVYLSGGSNFPASVIVGSSIALRQSKTQSNPADVTDANGKHQFALSEATRIMAFTPEHEGFFEIRPANGKRFQVAAHADRRESNLTRVPADSLILWRNTSSGGAVAREAKPETTTVPFSFWRYILGLVLIAAVVESIFATRYLSEERPIT